MRKFTFRQAWLAVATLALVMAAATAAQGAVTVQKIAYKGWHDCYLIANGTVRLIVTADVGPRVIFYGFEHGPNEFHEFPDQVGKTGGDQYQNYGGHRLWVAPENKRTYFPDNVPVKVVQTRRNGRVLVRFIAPEELRPYPTYLQKEMAIELAPSGSHVTVYQIITNRGQRAQELAPWSISQMARGGHAVFPFPPKAPWGPKHLQPVIPLALWSYTDFQDPRWTLGAKYLELQQSRNPKGPYKEQKIGLFDEAGWGAYYNRHHLFVVRVEVHQGADYPDFGCNFETYTEPRFLEFETLGPRTDLKPGQSVHHTEQWWLFDGVAGGKGDAWADAQVLPRVRRTRW